MDHRAQSPCLHPSQPEPRPPADATESSGASLQAAPPVPARASTTREYPTAWEEFVRTHRNTLRHRIYYVLVSLGVPRSEERIDEILQDVYFRLFRRYGHDLAPLVDAADAARSAYLRRTVRSSVGDLLRHRRAEKRGEARTVSLSQHEAACRAVTWEGRDPEQHALERASLRKLLRWIRAQLREGARGRRELAVLLLRAVEDRSSLEIVAALPGGLTRSAIDSIYHRLLGRLQQASRPLPA